MKTNFTKGEWHYVDYAGTLSIQDGPFYEDRNILRYNVFLEESPVTEKEAKANAVLICSAPDMFNALKDLYDDKEVFSELYESQQEFIVRVLNKATGSCFFKR